MQDLEDSVGLHLDFDPESLLVRDPHEIFHPQLLRNLRDELERDLGSEGARLTALQMGCLLGMRDGMQAADCLLWGGAIEGSPLRPALCMHYGCTQRVNSELALQGSWPLANESGLRLGDGFGGCLISTGYTSGWLSAATGVDLLALETSCRGQGDDACRFTALEEGGWGLLDDPRSEEVRSALPLAAFRALARDSLSKNVEENGPAPQPAEFSGGSIQLWPPLMVIHDAEPASAVRALELLESDPAAQGISVVILNFADGSVGENYSPEDFQPFLAAAEACSADAIYANPPEAWWTALPRVAVAPLAETESLEEAIGLGLQISRAQGWKL